MLNWREKTDKEIAKFCKSDFAAAKKRRGPYEPLYDMATKLFLPRRYDISQKRRKGEQYGVGVYDQYPAQALNKFAFGTTGNMVERDADDPWWLGFVAERQDMMQVDSIKQYMQDAEEQVRYGFNQATFYQEFPFILKDAACTYGCMTAEEDRRSGSMVFLTRNPKNHWIGIDRFGRIIADYFLLDYTAYDLLKDFGKDKLPADIVKQAEARENLDPFTEHEVLHCVYDNDSRRPGSLNHTDKPYVGFYILMDAAKGTQQDWLLAKEGVDWRPINLRIGATLGEHYPLTLALDAMTGGCYGNLLGKYKLQAAHLSIQPPWRIHRNLRDQVIRNKLNANSRTYFETPDETMEALMQKINWPIGDTELKELHDAIDWVFSVQFFELLSSSEQLPQMTAYQFSHLVQEKVTYLGPVIDMIQDFVLEPASSIVWAHETKAGRMPEPPDVLLEYTGGKIINRYMGRLAQLRRTVRKSKGVFQSLELMKVFAELWPSSLAKVRHFEFIERAGLTTGMDQDLFRSDEEMEQIEAGMQADEQQAKQLEAVEKLGKLAPLMLKGAEPNSAAASLTGASK